MPAEFIKLASRPVACANCGEDIVTGQDCVLWEGRHWCFPCRTTEYREGPKRARQRQGVVRSMKASGATPSEITRKLYEMGLTGEPVQ